MQSNLLQWFRNQLFGCRRDVSAGVAEVFAREEKRGARILLCFRLGVALLLFIVGLSIPSVWADKLSYLVLAAAYSAVVAVQMYLTRGNNLRALNRFSYFSLLADHAVFTFPILFYYQNEGSGNFNFVLKSPYLVLLLLPTLTTLLQFRFSLLVFSVATSLAILLGFFGFALLSRVPQSPSWNQYFLGQTIILPAWLMLYLPLPLMSAALIAYSIVRARRMASEMAETENRKADKTEADKDSALIRGDFAEDSLQQVSVLCAQFYPMTSMFERVPLSEMTALLSELRQLVARCVSEYSGTVVAFAGNALVAVFSAMRSQESSSDHSHNSTLCALSLLDALRELNAKRLAQAQDSFGIGIGIDAGEVFAGHLKSEQQPVYTVIGSVVTTASRIAHLCKKAQAELLVSETVAHQLPDTIVTERLGVVQIRGREQPLGIYRVKR
jgi:adenylate cyclase